MCTFCRKFYKGGGGGSVILQVLDRNFEKMLKVFQMLQFIQKWREKNFPFIDPPPPSPPCLGDSIVYLSLADVALALRNATKKGPTGYFLGSLLWGTLDSNVGGGCHKGTEIRCETFPRFDFCLSYFVFCLFSIICGSRAAGLTGTGL